MPTDLSSNKPLRRISRICRLLLRPVSDNPRFFLFAALLGALVPWIYAAVTGSRILWLILFASIQSVALSYLLSSLVMLIRGDKWRMAVKTAILLIMGLIALAEVGCIAATGEPLTIDSVNLARETDLGEATGFFAQYMSMRAISVIMGIIAAIVVLATIISLAISKLRTNRGGDIVVIPFCVVLLATVAAGGVRLISLLRPLMIDDYRDLLTWAAQDPGNPVLIRTNQLKFGDPLSKWTYILKELSLQNRNISVWEENQLKALESTASSDDSHDFNIVIIIGESFIRAHTPLYGYYLPTTPRLSAESDSGRLAVFTDMLTAANFTTTSLRNFLDLNDLSQGESWEEGVYFPLIIKKAGWKVFHYDNQTVSRAADAGISRLIYAPVNIAHTYDGVSDSLFRYDGDFTSYVEDRLRPRDKEGKKMVTYHLWGQHFPASDRFPGKPRFAVSDITVNRPWLDDDRRQAVADYDSATFYNDSVVGSIIDYWSNTPTLLFYFSDHGEDCWDLAPTGARNRPMPEDSLWLDRQYRIPFMVWMSDKFREAHPDLESRIRQAAPRPGMLDNLGQAVIGIAGISSPYYRPDRDITSLSYRPRPRITSEGYRFD